MQPKWGGGDAYIGFWWGKLRERNYLGDPGVDGDNIKMDQQEVECGGIDWIELAEDRNRWQALVNAVMKFLDQLKSG